MRQRGEQVRACYRSDSRGGWDRLGDMVRLRRKTKLRRGFRNHRRRRRATKIGVGALGRLEPGWKVFQIAPSISAEGARIESLLVEEGSEIEPGAVLAIMDTHANRLAALAESKAQVKVAQAKLALAKTGAKSDEVQAQAAAAAHLRVSYQSAMANYDRAATLKASRSISSEEYDEKRFQAEMAKHLVAQAEATLAALQTVRPEDVALAEAELVKAEAGVARAEADLEATNVRSPIAGRVLKIHSRQGEKVSNEGIAEIGNTNDMQAVAEVYDARYPPRADWPASDGTRTKLAGRVDWRSGACWLASGPAGGAR